MDTKILDDFFKSIEKTTKETDSTAEETRGKFKFYNDTAQKLEEILTVIYKDNIFSWGQSDEGSKGAIRIYILLNILLRTINTIRYLYGLKYFYREMLIKGYANFINNNEVFSIDDDFFSITKIRKNGEEALNKLYRNIINELCFTHYNYIMIVQNNNNTQAFKPFSEGIKELTIDLINNLLRFITDNYKNEEFKELEGTEIDHLNKTLKDNLKIRLSNVFNEEGMRLENIQVTGLINTLELVHIDKILKEIKEEFNM